jgi:hypothetical protein
VYLLLVVIHREELLDEALSVLVELELPDTVVVESRTGLELLERDLPIFAGLRSLIPGGIDFSRLIFCLVEEESLAREAMTTVARLGDDEPPSAGPRNSCVLIHLADVAFF